MRRFSSILTIMALVGLFSLTSCDSNGSMDDTGSTLVTLNVSGGTAAAGKTADDLVDIGSVKLLLKSIRFHTSDESVDGEGEEPPAEGDETEDDGTFRLEPVVVTIDPDADPVTVDVGELPDATYDKISFHIHKPRGNETIEGEPDFSGDSPSERYSVIVYDGSDQILYRSSLNVVQKADFATAFTTGDDGSAVTLEVDLSTWFVGADGGALDPSDDSPQNRSRIDRSIRDSFRVFRDDDEDGIEDEGTEG